MQLPYGATEDDFKKCKKIIANLINDKMNLDDVTLKIMNLSYATGGNYSEEIILEYAKTYLKSISKSEFWRIHYD